MCARVLFLTWGVMAMGMLEALLVAGCMVVVAVDAWRAWNENGTGE